MSSFFLHLRRILLSIVLGISIVALVLFVQPLFNEWMGKSRVNDTSVQELDLSIDTQLLQTVLNNQRISANLSPLTEHQSFCSAADQAVAQIKAGQELDTSIEQCPNCASQVLLSLTGTYNESEIINELLTTHSSDLLNPQNRQLCIRASQQIAVISLGYLLTDAAQAPANQNNSVIYVTPTQPNIRDIPDHEVVEALNQYRANHQVPQLVVNQNLCTYAEKRTQDLITYGGLDSHEGFKKDFENGQIPIGIREYGGGRIGENLAHQFCYRGVRQVVANTGTALIEWCFDSSTTGHREAQLDPRYTGVCVRHAQNMYVVIFGE